MATHELTDESRLLDDGTRVYRIRCTAPIPPTHFSPGIRVGDLGGWVESMTVQRDLTIDRIGEASWVDGEACVIGNARLSGSARVSESAVISDVGFVGEDAHVSGAAQVRGGAAVYGYARVRGAAVIHQNAEIFEYALVEGNGAVSGDAQVWGYGRVYGNALITGESRVSDFASVGDNVRVGDFAALTGRSRAHDDAVLSGHCYLGGKVTVFGSARISTGKYISASVGIRGAALIEHPEHLLIVDSFGTSTRPVAIYRTTRGVAVSAWLEEHVETDLESFAVKAASSIRAADAPEQLKAVWRDQVSAIVDLARATVASWGLSE